VRGASRARPFVRGRRLGSAPLETAARVSQHGEDLAGVRREIAAFEKAIAAVAGRLGQKALELPDVAIDGNYVWGVPLLSGGLSLEVSLAVYGAK